MALPSQTARPTSRRSYMYSRRHSRRRPVILALMGLLIIVVFAAIVVLDPFGNEEPAAEEGIAMSDRQADTQSAPDTDAAAEAAPLATGPSTSAPEEIQMGGGGGTGSADSQGVYEPVWPERTETPAQPPMAAEEQELPPVSLRQFEPTPEARRRALERMSAGMELLDSNRPVEARRMLTAALDSQALELVDEQLLREILTELNQRLVFSPEVVADDPFSRPYAIQQGDALSLIPRREALTIDWRLLKRINDIPNERRIRPGQRIKLVTGPFHAVVHKRAFRMDVYLGQGDDWAYVRSFPVGLGEFNSTPVGLFRVRPRSKLIDPEWVNPRTGQRYEKSDPANPIGEHWIGLEGVSEVVRDLTGYGIHGTIEPESIGRQSSLGCIRMLPEDVEVLFEMLVTTTSTVEIRED